MTIETITHPFAKEPELALKIISLKSKYELYYRDSCKEKEKYNEVRSLTSLALYNVKRRMIELLKDRTDINWCPYCNRYEDTNTTWDEDQRVDPFPDCHNFGAIMTYVRINDGHAGYECRTCGRQLLEKIEHWE